MFVLIQTSLKGFLRDRIFISIATIALFFLLVPAISTLSMRQVPELSLTLSTSLISFILFLLSVFLGGTSLWRDIEKGYTSSLLSLPLQRYHYVLGKFFGVVVFLLFTVILLSLVASVVVYVTTLLYPPSRALLWSNITLLFFFEALKYIMLVSCAFFFASVSTSFFLPVFGTVAIFFTGSVSQQAYDYVHSIAGQSLPMVSRNAATVLYYVLPNFSIFDLKAQAIYSIPLDLNGVYFALAYFVVYTSIVVSLTTLVFAQRELL